MKTKIGILVLALCATFLNVQAQRRITTARATSYDISDNLDLDAVASIFGDSENLEDFEYRLNDPDNRISNLDLNEDGYIDYLRVVENSSDRNSLVVIQAVLDKDVFQDVATIEIEKVQNGNLRVQVVGDDYIYGPNYIIEPMYVQTPLIFSFFWGPRYVTYHSPYYWDYYPRYFRYYTPYSPYKYQRNVYVHINRYNTYNRTNTRNIQYSGDNYNHIRRNDYASRYPNRAFENRNTGVKNRYELEQRRPSNQVSRERNNNLKSGSNRQYEGNRSSNSGRNDRQGNINQNKRPGSNVQSAPNQTRTRVNSKEGNIRERPGSSNNPVQIKSGSRNDGSAVSTGRSQENKQVQPTQRNSDSRNQSISRPTPDRSKTRVESTQRNSAPREKSGSVSGRSRSNSEVKQAPQNVRKSQSSNKEDKKETGNRRKR